MWGDLWINVEVHGTVGKTMVPGEGQWVLPRIMRRRGDSCCAITHLEMDFIFLWGDVENHGSFERLVRVRRVHMAFKRIKILLKGS